MKKPSAIRYAYHPYFPLLLVKYFMKWEKLEYRGSLIAIPFFSSRIWKKRWFLKFPVCVRQNWEKWSAGIPGTFLRMGTDCYGLPRKSIRQSGICGFRFRACHHIAMAGAHLSVRRSCGYLNTIRRNAGHNGAAAFSCSRSGWPSYPRTEKTGPWSMPEQNQITTPRIWAQNPVIQSTGWKMAQMGYRTKNSAETALAWAKSKKVIFPMESSIAGFFIHFFITFFNLLLSGKNLLGLIIKVRFCSACFFLIFFYGFFTGQQCLQQGKYSLS